MRLLIIILFMCGVSVTAQDLLLKQRTADVLADKEDFGPNKKKYRHGNFGLTFAVPLAQDNEVVVHGGSSFGLFYGTRIKRKLTNTFAVGYDLRLDYTQYRGKQDTSGVFTQNFGFIAPDSVRTDKVSYYSVQAAPYLRINFGQRGNHLGRYIDLAFYGEFLWATAHVVKTRHPNDDLVKESQIKNRGLSYVNKLQYGPELRYGNGFYNIFLSYRLSEFFNNKLVDDPYQLPQLKFGASLVLPG